MKNDIKYYQKQIKELFFISVDNNLDKWTKEQNYGNDFYSEKIGKHSLNLDTENKNLYLKTDGICEYTYICKYKILFIPINYKVNKYANRIKKYFNERENIKINMMKDCLSSMQECYVKELRKEKLKNIK